MQKKRDFLPLVNVSIVNYESCPFEYKRHFFNNFNVMTSATRRYSECYSMTLESAGVLLFLCFRCLDWLWRHHVLSVHSVCVSVCCIVPTAVRQMRNITYSLESFFQFYLPDISRTGCSSSCYPVLCLVNLFCGHAAIRNCRHLFVLKKGPSGEYVFSQGSS